MKTNRLIQTALNTEFPDKWRAIAVMLGLNSEYNEEKEEVLIEIGDTEFLSITRTNQIESSFSLSDDLITKALIETANKYRSNK